MIILKHAGKDATKLFESVHPSDTLEKFLTPEYVALYDYYDKSFNSR